MKKVDTSCSDDDDDDDKCTWIQYLNSSYSTRKKSEEHEEAKPDHRRNTWSALLKIMSLSKKRSFYRWKRKSSLDTVKNKKGLEVKIRQLQLQLQQSQLSLRAATKRLVQDQHTSIVSQTKKDTKEETLLEPFSKIATEQYVAQVSKKFRFYARRYISESPGNVPLRITWKGIVDWMVEDSVCPSFLTHTDVLAALHSTSMSLSDSSSDNGFSLETTLNIFTSFIASYPPSDGHRFWTRLILQNNMSSLQKKPSFNAPLHKILTNQSPELLDVIEEETEHVERSVLQRTVLPPRPPPRDPPKVILEVLDTYKGAIHKMITLYCSPNDLRWTSEHTLRLFQDTFTLNHKLKESLIRQTKLVYGRSIEKDVHVMLVHYAPIWAFTNSTAREQLCHFLVQLGLKRTSVGELGSQMEQVLWTLFEHYGAIPLSTSSRNVLLVRSPRMTKRQLGKFLDDLSNTAPSESIVGQLYRNLLAGSTSGLSFEGFCLFLARVYHRDNRTKRSSNNPGEGTIGWVRQHLQ